MKLRISLNAKKVDGSYGGGNQFATNLERFLENNGHEVFRSLVPNLDLILIVSSKFHHKTTSYDVKLVVEYKLLNPNTVIVHRVNSCDESRGNDLGINDAMLQVNQMADNTIFISSFIRHLFAAKGMNIEKRSQVILNGADKSIFHPKGCVEWKPDRKIRVVTHHWSSNYMKGFDIYERIDQLLAVEPYKDLFEFTLIGNFPLGMSFKNTKLIALAHGKNLAELLRQQHIYLTAARYEAAGMHHIEGIRCGLPVLFLNSGALPEYCQEYGIEFNLVNFEDKLIEIRKRYMTLKEKVLSCPYTETWMGIMYENFFQSLVADRRKYPLPSPRLIKKIKVLCIDRGQRNLISLLSLFGKVKNFLSRT